MAFEGVATLDRGCSALASNLKKHEDRDRLRGGVRRARERRSPSSSAIPTVTGWRSSGASISSAAAASAGPPEEGMDLGRNTLEEAVAQSGSRGRTRRWQDRSVLKDLVGR